MKITCKYCNKEIEKPTSQAKKNTNHFCSRSCSNSFNNIGRNRHTPKARTCKKCHDEYFAIKKHKSKHFCQKCSVKTCNRQEFTKTMTLSEFYSRPSVKDKHPSWRNVHVRNLNRTWNKSMRSLPCEQCGYDKYVELAHKKSVASFPITATLGEVNASSNVIQLCPNCHWEFDKGLLLL